MDTTVPPEIEYPEYLAETQTVLPSTEEPTPIPTKAPEETDQASTLSPVETETLEAEIYTTPTFIPVVVLADQVPLPSEQPIIQLEEIAIFDNAELDVITEPPAGDPHTELPVPTSSPAKVPEVVVAKPPMAVKTKGAPPAAAPASATPAPSNNATMGGSTSKNTTNAPASYCDSIHILRQRLVCALRNLLLNLLFLCLRL